MPAISQSPRAIFQILKNEITSLAHDSSYVRRTVLGNEHSHLVVDSFTASVPGAMTGQNSAASVNIQSASSVDNRPETNDSVYFSANGNEYSASEYRYVDSDGGVTQSLYGLEKWDGRQWQNIDGLA